jgi:tetratricopeptide (TPR) repeat protein
MQRSINFEEGQSLATPAGIRLKELKPIHTDKIQSISEEKLLHLEPIKTENDSLSLAFLKKIVDFFHADIFVETGTFIGNTTMEAAKVFQEVHTIELSRELFQKARYRFRNYNNIHLYHGDSAMILKDILPHIQGKPVFWLEGHYRGGETAFGNENTPIMKEIQLIRQHNIQNAVILVDDIRCFYRDTNPGSIHYGYPTIRELLSAILDIDHTYCFEIMGDVAIAYPLQDGIQVSSVIRGCTISRFYDENPELSDWVLLEAEKAISFANGIEEEAIKQLCKRFSLSNFAGWNKIYTLWLGLIFYNRKQLAEAIQIFTMLLSAGFNHWRINWYLARAAYESGKLHTARTSLFAVLKAQPEFKDAQELLVGLEADTLKENTPTIFQTIDESENRQTAGRFTINIVYGHMSQKDIKAYNRGNISIVWSSLPVDGCDHYVYHNAFSYRGNRPGLSILLMLEPDVVLPGEFDERIWKYFDHVFGLFDALMWQNIKFHKILFPRADGSPKHPVTELQSQREFLYPLSGRKNAICMISGNKRSHVPGELYSKRIEVAKWFSRNSDIPFDVYGRPPFPLTNYRGAIPDGQKLSVQKKYRYSLCFENTNHSILSAGYITEKILDCFETRTIPIYLGASNIEKYIPEDCFIDFRKFDNLEGLDNYLRNMADKDYERFISAIDAWVVGGNLRKYSSSPFYDSLAELCAASSSISLEKLFAGDKTWTEGKATPPAAGDWKFIDAPVMWTWKHLSKAEPPVLENGKIISKQQLNSDTPGSLNATTRDHKSFLIGKKPSIKVLTAGVKFFSGNARQGYDYGWWNMFDALHRFENVEVQFYDYLTEAQQRGVAGMSDRLMEIVCKGEPDLLLYSPFDLHADILYESLKAITDHTNTQTIIWMNSSDDDSAHLWAPCVNNIITTSNEAVSKYHEAGFGHKVIKSQFGFNPFTYQPTLLPRARNISFIGSARDNRSGIIDKMLQSGLDVDLFGPGWGEDTYIPFYDMVRIFSQSRINLNLSSSSTITSRQIKRRIFEVTGCRGFLLTTPADNLEEYYEPDKEMVFASSLEELIDKSSYYLAHEREREEIAQRGYERTLAEHTWTHRFIDIFKRIGFTAVALPLPQITRSPYMQSEAFINPSGNILYADADPPTIAQRDNDDIPTSISVMAYNQLEYTKHCVESILHYTAEPYELLLTDNGSTDGTFEYFERVKSFHPDTRIIRNFQNRNVEANTNFVCSLARGKYIVGVSNDIMVHDCWLKYLIKQIESAPNIGMAGPRCNNISGPQAAQAEYDTLEAYHTFAAEWSRQHRGENFPVSRIVGMFTITKKSVLERIGGWDPDLPTNGRDGAYGYSDDDFSLRMRVAGYKLLVASDVFIHHFGSATAGKYRPDLFGPAQNINKEKYLQKLRQNERITIGLNGELTLKPYGPDEDIPVARHTIIRFPRICIVDNDTNTSANTDSLNTYGDLAASYNNGESVSIGGNSTQTWLIKAIMKEEYDFIVFVDNRLAPSPEKVRKLTDTALCYPDVAIMVPIGNYAPLTHDSSTEKMDSVEIIQYADLSFCVINLKLIRPFTKILAQNIDDDEFFWFLQRRICGEGYFIAKACGIMVDIDYPSVNHPYDTRYLPEQLVEEKKYAEAIAIYKEDLIKDPYFVDSLYRLALIAREHGQVSEAIQYAEDALRIDPHHIQSLIFLSKVFIKQGDLELAETVVRLANFKQPGNIEVQEVVAQYEQLKNLHHKSVFLPKKQEIGLNTQQSNGKGDREKALHDYETAARLEPDNVAFSKNLADFYYVEQGRVEDALKIYVDILAKEPKNLEILLIIGHICVSLRKFDDAKVFYNRVLEIEPQNRDAQQNLDKILSRGLSEIRGQDVETNIISDHIMSKSPEGIYQSIQPLIQEEKFDKAIEKFEELLESYPGFSPAHNDLGVLYYKQGNKEKALDHYENAAELEPENMTFQKNLADFYCSESGRLEDALRIYNRVLESEPSDLEALFAIGYICESLQQFEDAKIFYSKILEVEPWNEDARKNLDRFLAKEMSGELPKNIEQKSSNVNQEIEPLITESTALAATIIINCSSKKKELKNCLQSIKNNTFLNYNIVFINRGAAKGALKLMKRLVSEDKDKKYSLIKKKKKSSLADSYNDALKIAAGKYLVFMHDDVVVPENWLSDMIECMDIDSETGLAGPISNNADGIQTSLDPGYQSFDEFFDYSRKFREVNRHRRVFTRKLSGFCVMLKQEVVEKTGLFDKQFDTETFMMQDYCLRAIIAGYQNVIAGDLYVHHNDDCRLMDSVFGNKGILHAEQKIFFEKWSGLDAKGAMGKGLIAFKALETADKFSHKGDVEKAVDALLDGIGNSHDDRSLYIAAADILAAAKQFQAALDTLDEIPQIEGGFNSQTSLMEEARILVLRGFCMAGLNRDDEAQEYTEKALLLDHNFASALNLKGMLAYKNGNNPEAENFFKRAIAADPSYGEPYTHLGTMKWEACDEEEALEFYERGFILAPAVFDVAALYHAAMTAKENFSRCEKFSRDAAALFPDNKKIEYMLIDMLIKQGKYDEAMENVEAAIVKFGIDDGILAAAGRLRDVLGPMEIDKSSKKDKTVSLCMIVKNEEKYLAKCLQSVKPVVDEMIVIDTGSTDRTSDLARVFGARVYYYKWDNDFANARNCSISRASGAWIFILDADEVLSSIDYKAFRNIIDGNTDKLAAYLITTRNYTNKTNIIGWMINSGEYPDEEAGAGWVPTRKARLFHNSSRIRFDYPVHEMIDPSLLREGASVYICDIPVHHYGKLDEKNCVAKGEKYYFMGVSKLEEMGDSEIALRELAVQAGVLGRNEEAIDLWQRFLALDLRPDNKFIGDAYVNMASAYGKIGKYEDASISAKKAMELFPNMKEAPYAYAYAELFCGNPGETISIIENLLTQVSEYPPAHFLLVMAHICSGMKKKGIDGLERLKKTLNISVVAVACHEFAKALFVARKIEYALLVLEYAMESNITSKDILSLFSECLKKRERTFAAEKAA